MFRFLIQNLEARLAKKKKLKKKKNLAILGAVLAKAESSLNLSNTFHIMLAYFVQLRIAKVKQTTTNGIDSTFRVLQSLLYFLGTKVSQV